MVQIHTSTVSRTTIEKRFYKHRQIIWRIYMILTAISDGLKHETYDTFLLQKSRGFQVIIVE